MRTLKTSLTLLTLICPVTALAQDAVTPEELPEDQAADEQAPDEEPAPDAAGQDEAAQGEAAQGEAAQGEAAQGEAAEDDPAAPGAATDQAAAAEGPAATTPATEPPAPTGDAQASGTAGFQGQADTTAAGAATAATPAETLPPEAPADSARPSAPRTRGGPEEMTGKWEFNYSGYFRAPMRLGIGSTAGPQYVTDANPEGRVPELDENGVQTGRFHPNRNTVHYPVIPDDQYPSFQFTGHNKRDWAEMFFSVGNGVASGNLAIQGFQFTDSAWKQDIAQFGIGQGWVEIDHDLGYENVKFNAKVGSFWNRYGMAGVYDSGEYDTYLIARTHVMGGTARADIDLGGMSVGFEGGAGAKQPDPDMFNRARFTPLVHGHGFFEMGGIDMGIHALHAWSSQEVVPHYPAVLPGSNCGDGAQCTVADQGLLARSGTDGQPSVFSPEYPTGKQTVVGIDAKFDLGLGGYLFAGYSHHILENALVVGSAIESIHSLGAGEYTLGVVDNYLESPYCPTNAQNDSCSNGTGSVGTIMAQYELGLANFGIFPGQQDLQFSLYGMMSFVSVSDNEVLWLEGMTDDSPEHDINDVRQDGTIKSKFGLDAEYFFLEWMSAGLRFDRVMPHSKVPEQSFNVLSPRVAFRTQLVTHEEIALQYSRYIYDKRVCTDPGNPNARFSPADDQFRTSDPYSGQIFTGNRSDNGLPGRVFCTQPAPSGSVPSGLGATANNQDVGTRGAPTLLPDENVIKLEASIWW